MRITKEQYLQPFTQVLSLEPIRETLQSTSSNAGGSNLGDPTTVGGDWTDWFNNGMVI